MHLTAPRIAALAGLVAATACGTPPAYACSSPGGFTVVWPLDDEMLPVDSPIVVRGSFDAIEAATLRTDAGEEVPIDFRSLGSDDAGHDFIVVDPVEELLADETYTLTMLAAYEGPGSGTEYPYTLETGSQTLAIPEPSELESQAISYFTDDASDGAMCMRDTERSFSTLVALPASDAPRFVYTQSSEGIAGLFVGPGPAASVFVALLPVAAQSSTVTLNVMGLDGSPPTTTTLGPPDFCYDTDGAFEHPNPPVADRWPLYVSEVEKDAEACVSPNPPDTRAGEEAGCATTPAPLAPIGAGHAMLALFRRRRPPVAPP